MKQNRRIQLVLCILSALTASSMCFGQGYTPQPFSADMLVTTKVQGNVTGKFFFSPPSTRMDMNAKGHNVSFIADGDTQVSYVIMHDQHMYMEMHANGGQANPMMGQIPKIDTNYDLSNPCAAAHHGGTCKKLGTETINGRLCDKWEGTSSQGTDTLWIDQKLHFPMKAVNTDGTAMEFSNVVEGRVDGALFRPPSGYRKMDMPNMMGGRPPQ